MKKTAFAFAFLAVFGAAAQGILEDFETGAAELAWSPLGQNALLNGAFSVVDNPFSSPENPSAKVGRYEKGVSPFSVLVAQNPVDLAQKGLFDLKIWLPSGASTVQMTLFSATQGTATAKFSNLPTEKWTKLTFDFSAFQLAQPAWSELRLLFEPGDAMAGAAFFFDDLLQNGQPPAPPSGNRCVENFEGPDLALESWGAFQNGSVEPFSLVQNPSKTGINLSGKCGKATEGGLASGAGQPWGGMYADLAEPIKFVDSKKIRMKVWMPAAPRKVTMKLEGPAGSTADNTVEAQKAGEWEQLEWNFAAANAPSYNRLTLIWNIDATPATDQIYFFDDIEIGSSGACQTVVSNFEPLENAGFRVWPNPTEGPVFFEKGGLEIERLEVFDALGRRVLTAFLGDEKGASLDVSGLEGGVFFVLGFDEKGRAAGNAMFLKL